MAHYPTIFISDVHLGTRGCRAELLTHFLRENSCDTLYLVGDIFDGWQIKRSWHWPSSQNEVVHQILKKARKGTRVVFIPGNHDEVMRSFPGIHFGGIEVKDQDTFTSRNGKKYLVTHGDQFDTVIAHAKWLAYLGDRAYGALIWLNPKINRLMRLWKQEYWSLSKWSKQQVKQAVSYIVKFEQLLSDDARSRGFDGVVCGHIHHAAIRDLDGIEYVNTGDWVESCTAIVEDPNGTLGIPPAQYDKLASDADGDIIPVLKARARKLFCGFPIQDNYFAYQAANRGYKTDGTGPVPPYLMAENFDALRSAEGRATVLNGSITDVLAQSTNGSKSVFILLDAQDWMSDGQLNALWSETNRTARSGARVLFRTGGRDDILPGRVAGNILNQWSYDAEASSNALATDRSAIYGGVHLYRKAG